MPNPFFQFKQFTVYHDLCAMKVGTDGVLLGAWADCSKARTILDVGTGSGLIALMLAQRSDAIVHALDVDEGAYKQASYNFDHSPFSGRLSVDLCDYRDFVAKEKYDLIVSNPPYFVHSLQSPHPARSRARHCDELFVEALVSKSAGLLTDCGKLSVTLPYEAFDRFHTTALNEQLVLSRKTIVRPMNHYPPKRLLLEYSLSGTLFSESELYLEKSRHVYGDDYVALTRDFYLKF